MKALFFGLLAFIGYDRAMIRVISLVISLIILSFALNGCSLYQSDGREFLEDKAFEFGVQGTSVSAKSVVEPCAELNGDLSFLKDPGWIEVAESYSPSYHLYQSNRVKYGFALVTQDLRKKRAYVCNFIYSSEEEFHSEQAHDVQLGLETIENHFQ